VPAAYLEIRRSDGAEVVSLVGECLTLGRSPDNTVSFPSVESVSRHHAVLERLDDGWLLRDAGSSNGTFVNGAKIGGGMTLRTGDEITLGEVVIVFRLDGAATATHAIAPHAERAVSAMTEPAASPGGYLDVGEEWRSSPAQAAGPPATRREHAAAAASATAPQPAPTAPPPGGDPARRGRATVRGIARGVQVRSLGQEQHRDVLAFRVDRYDASGNQLSPVGVEFRDYGGGLVSEGEEVEARGRWSRGTLLADKVINLSTRSEVHGPSGALKFVYIVIVLLIIAFIAYIIISATTSPGVENPFE
jgi:hypothetical protein